MELVVKAEDLSPVSLLGPSRVGMHGGNGCLERQRAGGPSAQRLQHQRGVHVAVRVRQPDDGTVKLAERFRAVRRQVLATDDLSSLPELNSRFHRLLTECAASPTLDELLDGKRHIFEAEMKELRRTRGNRGHEKTPEDAL